MKIIIAGSRNITNENIVKKIIKKLILKYSIKITEVVSGCAKGIDTIGERFAVENNIPVKLFPADWDKYGKAAGVIRNKDMAEYADGLIAIWDGRSRGTKHMINCFNKDNEVKKFAVVYIIDN